MSPNETRGRCPTFNQIKHPSPLEGVGRLAGEPLVPVQLSPAPAARHMLMMPRARSRPEACLASPSDHLPPLNPPSFRSQVYVEASAASTYLHLRSEPKAP